MNESPRPPSAPPIRPSVQLAVLGASAVGALYLGFVHFSVSQAQAILRAGGYFGMLLTFLLWCRALARAAPWRDLGARPGRGELLLAGAVIALLLAMALGHETFRAKILFDEYVLQATAFNLHFFRDNSAIVRGYELAGTFVSLDSYLDKRPVFFPFLLSLVHDLTGFRRANVFWLNGALFAFALTLIYALGRRLNGWRGGFLALVLLGSLPLLAQNASGAGMELLNVTMLLVAMVLGASWFAHRDAAHLNAFVLGVVLLVQSRYESALYVLPAAALILLGWWRERACVLSWTAMLSPWFLLPVALQQKVLSNNPVMWELRENQTSRFSVSYLGDNLRGAWDFFAADGLVLANSRLLGLLGVIALPFVALQVGRACRRWREADPVAVSLLAFGAASIGITAMIMFYYWAALSDPMASRFALPLYVACGFLAVGAARAADARWPVSAVAVGVAVVSVFAVSTAKQSYHFYSHLGNDELDWERRVVDARPRVPRLLVVNKSTLPWMIERTPAILLGRARVLADRLADQLQGPDFAEILVTQSARPRSAAGDFAIVPEDELPPWMHLQLLAERRFGTKLARISRLVAVDLPANYQPGSAPTAGDVAAATGRTNAQ